MERGNLIYSNNLFHIYQSVNFLLLLTGVDYTEGIWLCGYYRFAEVDYLRLKGEVSAATALRAQTFRGCTLGVLFFSQQVL